MATDKQSLLCLQSVLVYRFTLPWQRVHLILISKCDHADNFPTHLSHAPRTEKSFLGRFVLVDSDWGSAPPSHPRCDSESIARTWTRDSSASCPGRGLERGHQFHYLVYHRLLRPAADLRPPCSSTHISISHAAAAQRARERPPLCRTENHKQWCT